MALDVDITTLIQQERECIQISCKYSSVQGGVLELVFLVQKVHHELHALKVFLQRCGQIVQGNDDIEDLLEVILYSNVIICKTSSQKVSTDKDGENKCHNHVITIYIIVVMSQ